MDWSNYLFSFEGRINRARYWLMTPILIGIMVLIFFVAWILPAGVGPVLAGVLLIPAFLLPIAVTVKRLHDRDKSAWWLLVFYVLPAVLDGVAAWMGREGSASLFSIASAGIALWTLVELGFLRGTVGPNRFGPDPLKV